MSTTRIAITLETDMLKQLDTLVSRRIFPNRSRVIQEAIKEKVSRVGAKRLARECAKLDPVAEQALAEEGMSMESGEWAEY